jgi:hypothetical protein
MYIAFRRPPPEPHQVAAHAVDEACKELGYALDVLYSAEAEWNERMPRSAGEMRMRNLRHTCRYLEEVNPRRTVAEVITTLWRVGLRLKAMADADYVDVTEACAVLQRISDSPEWCKPAILFAERCHITLPYAEGNITSRMQG